MDAVGSELHLYRRKRSDNGRSLTNSPPQASMIVSRSATAPPSMVRSSLWQKEHGQTGSYMPRYDQSSSQLLSFPEAELSIMGSSGAFTTFSGTVDPTSLSSIVHPTVIEALGWKVRDLSSEVSLQSNTKYGEVQLCSWTQLHVKIPCVGFQSVVAFYVTTKDCAVVGPILASNIVQKYRDPSLHQNILELGSPRLPQSWHKQGPQHHCRQPGWSSAHTSPRSSPALSKDVVLSAGRTAMLPPSQTPTLHPTNLGLPDLRVVLPQEGPLIQITVNSRIEYSPAAAAAAAFTSPKCYSSEPGHPNWWRARHDTVPGLRYLTQGRTFSAPNDSQLGSSHVEGRSDDRSGALLVSNPAATQSETSRKRPSRDEDDDEQSKDGQRPSKRPNIESSEFDASLKSRRLACPYQKFDPEGEPCCGQRKAGNLYGGFHTVSRIKSHLKDSHDPSIKCGRCWRRYDRDGQPHNCYPRASPQKYWMTARQSEQLNRTQYGTESDKWYRLLRLLIPELSGLNPGQLEARYSPWYEPPHCLATSAYATPGSSSTPGSQYASSASAATPRIMQPGYRSAFSFSPFASASDPAFENLDFSLDAPLDQLPFPAPSPVYVDPPPEPPQELPPQVSAAGPSTATATINHSLPSPAPRNSLPSPDAERQHSQRQQADITRLRRQNMRRAEQINQTRRRVAELEGILRAVLATDEVSSSQDVMGHIERAVDLVEDIHGVLDDF